MWSSIYEKCPSTLFLMLVHFKQLWHFYANQERVNRIWHQWATCKIRKRKFYDTSGPGKRHLTVYGTSRLHGRKKQNECHFHFCFHFVFSFRFPFDFPFRFLFVGPIFPFVFIFVFLFFLFLDLFLLLFSFSLLFFFLLSFSFYFCFVFVFF